ncbi:MAG: tetratricopeptide repeat protein [Myxococcales bacterium]|nr:tetratricopeptide repeat protein [Myxococcales bacterium]
MLRPARSARLACLCSVAGMALALVFFVTLRLTAGRTDAASATWTFAAGAWFGGTDARAALPLPGDRGAEDESPAAKKAGKPSPLATGKRRSAGAGQPSQPVAKKAEAAKPLSFDGPLAPAWLALRSGGYAEVLRAVDRVLPSLKSSVLRSQAEALAATALRRSGQLEKAEKRLTEHLARDPHALDVRVELGLCLRQRGDRDQERAQWNRIFDDHDAGLLDMKDPRTLRLLGVAARYLGSYHDANDTLRDAVAAAKERKELFELSLGNIEWADLFLEKYRADNAEESLTEALSVDPENADALALMAQVRMERSNRVSDAEENIAHALRSHPRHPLALALRAELAIDAERYEEALPISDQLLQQNAQDLRALSVRAAALYLLDRPKDFSAVQARVLAQHPTYSSFHRYVAERLVIQHRYDEAVQLLEQATALSPKDFYSLADLGSGYLRLGQDEKGVDALRRAWKGDRFNRRCKNLLDLFEKTLADKYTVLSLDVSSRAQDRGKGGLRMRVPKDEQALLVPLLLPMIQREWQSLAARYHFTPKLPLTLELFSDPDDYAIRTVGLPGLAALGVTFGQVVTGRSPAEGNFNWGLMIWHELSHVFAIQLSKSRVPRWFTEGLSEWETTQAHPEWVRRTHAELYAALRDGTLLSIADINSGFTRAQDVAHIVIAYHEAAVAIDFLIRRFGFDKIVDALQAFGAGKRTPEVLVRISGMSIPDLDRAFRADLAERLSAYRGTFFVRPSDYSDREGLERAIKQLEATPKERLSPADKIRLGRLHGLFAVGMVRSGAGARQSERVDAEIAAALAHDPSNKEALLAEAESLLRAGKRSEAEARFRGLIAAGGDGFDVRQRLGELYAFQAEQDPSKLTGAVNELEQAKKLDPDRSEPYERLAALYEKHGQLDRSLKELQAALRLDIMDPDLATRTLAKLHEAKHWDSVVNTSEFVRHLVPYSAAVRAQIGEALLRLGRKRDAEHELQAAQQILSLAKASGDAGENGDDPVDARLSHTVEQLLKEARGR